ncbi:MAG: hypothetical protein ACK5Q5_19695 [Planctomycetaceae bacterium]
MSRAALSVSGLPLWGTCLFFGTLALANEPGVEPSSAGPLSVSEAEVRQALEAAATSVTEGPPRGRALDFYSRGENGLRIEEAFDKRVDLEFIDTELAQVLKFLSDRYQIAILPDTNRLTDFGVGLDTPVNLVLSRVTLRSALELILDPLKLDYVTNQEVLHITTREHADRVMEVHLYDLRRLPSQYTSDDLASTIQQSVLPGNWRVEPQVISRGAGTPGESAVPFYSDSPGNNRNEPKSPQQAAASDAAKPASLAGAAANPDRGSIQALPGCLIIRQTQRGHREIANLLGQFDLFTSIPVLPIPAGQAAREIPESLDKPQQIARLYTACQLLQTQIVLERRRHGNWVEQQAAQQQDVQRQDQQELKRRQQKIERLEADVKRLTELLTKVKE